MTPENLWQTVGLTPVSTDELSQTPGRYSLQHKATGVIVRSTIRTTIRDTMLDPPTLGGKTPLRDIYMYSFMAPDETYSVHLQHLDPEPWDTNTLAPRKQVENYKIALHSLKVSTLWETLITQEAMPIMTPAHVMWHSQSLLATRWELKSQDMDISIVLKGIPCRRPTQFKAIQEIYAAANIDHTLPH